MPHFHAVGGVGVGWMITFFALANMLDATELLTLFRLAHMLAAAELWGGVGVGRMITFLHVGCYGTAHVLTELITFFGLQTCWMLRMITFMVTFECGSHSPQFGVRECLAMFH